MTEFEIAFAAFQTRIAARPDLCLACEDELPADEEERVECEGQQKRFPSSWS